MVTGAKYYLGKGIIMIRSAAWLKDEQRPFANSGITMSLRQRVCTRRNTRASTIAKDGSVQDLTVIDGDALLAKSSERAVKKWR